MNKKSAFIVHVKLLPKMGLIKVFNGINALVADVGLKNETELMFQLFGKPVMIGSKPINN